jgi:hypothetical protein
MRPVSLIGVSFQDGTPHSYGMSVLRSAILHHQIKKPAFSGLFHVRAPYVPMPSKLHQAQPQAEHGAAEVVVDQAVAVAAEQAGVQAQAAVGAAAQGAQ